MVRLSIIIPVHNAKEDLVRALDSIIPQVCEHDEILLIEDSSNDGSYELCDEYANKYSFIQTYHVNFRGPSPTRSHGILKSKGEYILFIDSDDWIESNTISEMMSLAKNYEMVVSGYLFESDTNIVEKRISNKNEINTQDIFELYNAELLNVLWNKIFHGSIIREHHILFNEKLKKGEDLLFILQYIQHMKTKIAIVDQCFYHYISKETGINKSHKETMQDKRDRMYLIMNEFLKVISDKNLFVSHMLNLYFRHIRDYINIEQNISSIHKLLFIKKQARDQIVNDILKHGSGMKIMFLKMLHMFHLDVVMLVLNRLFLK